MANFPGWKRHRLLRDLAELLPVDGTETEQLEKLQPVADKYRCAAKKVLTFLQENLYVVEEVKADADNEFAGLWITDRAVRIAAHEQFVQDIEDALDAGWSDDPQVYIKLRRLQQLSLRYVEESLGQLPNRITITPDSAISVRYVAEGAEGLK